MFSWECGTCGRTIDIAETECPFCKKEGISATPPTLGAPAEAAPPAAPATPVTPPPPAPQPFVSAPHTPAPAPKPFVSSPEPQLPPVEPVAPVARPMQTAEPSPLGTSPAPPVPAPDPFAVKSSHAIIGLLALLLAIGAAVFFARPDLIPTFGGSADAATPGGAVWGNAGYDGFEIGGVRPFFDPDTNSLKVRYLVINHNDRERLVPELNVSLRPAEARADLPAIATFRVTVPDPIGGYASEELVANLAALGTVQSMPDWEVLRVQLTTMAPPPPPE